jgi:hypothetical protein
VHPTLIGDDLGADVRGQFRRSLLNVGMSLFGPIRTSGMSALMSGFRAIADLRDGGRCCAYQELFRFI